MKPARMFSEAPPSRAAVTISRTCRDSVEVNTFTSSGMTAPASVPQVMIEASFHHRVGSPPSCGISRYEATYVKAMETNEVSHTSVVRGVSKLKDADSLKRAEAMAQLIQYDTAEVTIMITRMTKIQTRSCVCTIGSATARRMNVISATPVT